MPYLLLRMILAWFARSGKPAAGPVVPVPTTPQPAKPPAPALTDSAARIVATMLRKGFAFDDGEDEVNIVYVAGVDPDGTPNRDRPNAFDDARFVVAMRGGKPVVLGAWEATIETGECYTERPINANGAARIAFGQHRRAWSVGIHHAGKPSAQEALIQVEPITVYRDRNKDYDRDGDPADAGLFGINQHHGYDYPRDNIGPSSAGCLVGRLIAGHRQFMSLVKSDHRYQSDHGFLFSTTILEKVD